MTKDQGKKTKNLPSKIGVYLFKDKDGRVLYIGKALNIKRRIQDHYRSKSESFLAQVGKIDYILADSEVESLLLEARLIKQYQPKHNISLKDGTRFLYVGITRGRYPIIKLIRQPEAETRLKDWYGPFPSSQSLREILRLLRRIFPYCTCNQKSLKPCFYYHLKLCPGVNFQEVKDYAKTIGKIRLFLNGQIGLLTRSIKKEMQQASKNLEYEKAAEAKRQIIMIENLLRRPPKRSQDGHLQRQLEELKKLLILQQKFDPLIIHRLEAYDIANLGNKIVVGSMAVLSNGEPETSSYRQFKIRQVFRDDTAALREVITRRFQHPEWLLPQVILVDGGKSQVSTAFEVLLSNNLVNQIGLLGLTKKSETIIAPRILRGKIISWKTLNYGGWGFKKSNCLFL